MPEILEKTITINKWHNGMSDVDLDEYALPGQCSYAQQCDLIEGKPFLKPAFASASDAGGISGSTGIIGRIRGYATKTRGFLNGPTLYAVDYGTAVGGGAVERLGVYKKNAFADANWLNVDHDESAGIGSSEPLIGCEFYDNDNMFFADASGGSDVSIGTYKDSTETITIGWDSLTDAWGGSSGALRGMLKHTDGDLYFLKVDDAGQGYLGPYDGSSKPSTIPPASMPQWYDPVDLISLGNKILILGNSLRGERSRLFVRDPYQSITYTFDDIYELNLYRAQALRIINGRVIIITADYDYKIWEWLGGDQIKLLKKLSVGGSNASFSVRPQAVDVKDNVLYFGTTCAVTTFNNGVYAFGFGPDGTPFLHNAIVEQNNDTSVMQWRAIKWYDDETSVGMVGTVYDTDATAYRNIDNVIDTTRATTAVWESVWIRPYPGLKSDILKMSLYHEKFGASTNIIISQKIDSDANSYTAIATASGTGNVKTVIGKNKILSGGGTWSSAFLKGHKHKIKVELKTTDAQLEKIKIRARTSEQE